MAETAYLISYPRKNTKKRSDYYILAVCVLGQKQYGTGDGGTSTY